MPHQDSTQISPGLFKAYDIRGRVRDALTPPVVTRIGAAIGHRAATGGPATVVVGRDGRLSSPELACSLRTGLMAAGVDVIDIGLATTPMCYFAAIHLGVGHAVMVTGSHNPPDENGLKIVLSGEALSGDAIQALAGLARDLPPPASRRGTCRDLDIAAAYQQRIVQDVRLTRPMKVMVDAGNGVAGAYGPALYRALGCEVAALYCEVDGHFPNHHPDPSVPANLAELVGRMEAGQAEVGLAFDGDGDRLWVVARDGRIIYPDRLLMLFADEILGRHPEGGVVIYDVKSSRHLDAWIARRGGQPLMWRTGHSVIKAKMRETGALLAGEMSGHLFFQDRWYGFDDGLYAGARLLEILSRGTDAGEPLAALPDAVSTPELHIPLEPGEAHRVVARLGRSARFPGAERVIDLDGLRVEYESGFGLVRASNTTPNLVLRFEADDAPGLAAIQRRMAEAIRAVFPDLPGIP
ncbi:MAG TPA: phosphomannomutase/phosphoglucomutase [Thiobacillaceae bacterium]|nr:phosphomannomutase/phosphoglucomutase [Thiobacillaceae bacterium]HNH89657.1 phosphomannomutase/phosphoglucomutase [Thiobacillaceae bacterium]